MASSYQPDHCRESDSRFERRTVQGQVKKIASKEPWLHKTKGTSKNLVYKNTPIVN
uniref:Uncharacterized protein n=1 Tax=Lepeophtheirus salmonis TaxID=72036 RepID=A0A0K2TA76_LEPSM